MGAMAITSSSTPAEVWAAFIDNSDYDDTRDRAKAMVFRKVCRILIGKYRTMSAGEEGRTYSLESLQQMLQDVDDWINANPDKSAAGYHGRNRYFAMENYRG
jgi:hypothetical protein